MNQFCLNQRERALSFCFCPLSSLFLCSRYVPLSRSQPAPHVLQSEKSETSYWLLHLQLDYSIPEAWVANESVEAADGKYWT